MPIPAEDRPLPPAPARERRVEYTTCYMGACRCGIQVTLEDDELRFIHGTRDHSVNMSAQGGPRPESVAQREVLRAVQ